MSLIKTERYELKPKYEALPYEWIEITYFWIIPIRVIHGYDSEWMEIPKTN